MCRRWAPCLRLRAWPLYLTHTCIASLVRLMNWTYVFRSAIDSTDYAVNRVVLPWVRMLTLSSGIRPCLVLCPSSPNSRSVTSTSSKDSSAAELRGVSSAPDVLSSMRTEWVILACLTFEFELKLNFWTIYWMCISMPSMWCTGTNN